MYVLATYLEAMFFQELWKSKRKDRSHADDDEDGQSERKKKREKKRRKKDRHGKTYNEINEPDADMVEEPEEMMEEDDGELRNAEEDGAENAQDLLVAAGLEDFEDEDATVSSCLDHCCLIGHKVFLHCS